MVENGDVRKAVLTLILLSLPFILSAADEGSARTFFPSKASAAEVLPVDATLGQISRPDASKAHIALCSMLLEPYSFEWTERHLREQERQALVRVFGQWLSENLGSEGFLMSVASENGDGSVSIGVRVNGGCMAFVLKDGLVISMKEL